MTNDGKFGLGDPVYMVKSTIGAFVVENESVNFILNLLSTINLSLYFVLDYRKI